MEYFNLGTVSRITDPADGGLVVKRRVEAEKDPAEERRDSYRLRSRAFLRLVLRRFRHVHADSDKVAVLRHLFYASTGSSFGASTKST